jgi:Holliday junction resolvase
MRRAAKIDANQPLIVRALRDAGASVLSLANMGKGCPDLLVGVQGKNFLMEVKDPSQPHSQRKMTADELAFHASWRGHHAVVETPEEALKVIAQ